MDVDQRRTTLRRILLVEDESTLRYIIRLNLERGSVEVSEAETATAALAAIRQQPPDLLLLDINLPDRTGWDVLRELRASGAPLPQTIVISAERVSSDRLRDFGIEAFLPKPFSIGSLTRLVARSATTVAAT